MNDRGWLRERPEPILAQTMATEAVIARREAADEPHPLNCTGRCCAEPDMDLRLDGLYPDLGSEDEEQW